MDPRSLELLNRELDQRLDDSERAELARRLAYEPELRAHRNQLRQLHRVLADAPAPSPPPDLHLNTIRRVGTPPARSRRWPAVALALAASVAVAAVALPMLLTLDTGPSGQLAGTLAPPRATVEVSRVPGGLQLVLEVPPGAPGDVTIEFAGTDPDLPGALSATADGPVRPRLEGRRIVLKGVAPGRTTLRVEGEVASGGMSAILVRGGDVTQFTPRSGLQ